MRSGLIAALVGLALGFGGGWIAKDLTKAAPTTVTEVEQKPVCETTQEELNAWYAEREGEEPACIDLEPNR